MSGSIKDFKVEKIDLHTFTGTDRAIVVLGTGPKHKVLLFVGPSDADGFVSFSKCEVYADALDGYISGLFKVRKVGSSFQLARSVTAVTGGTVCSLEFGGQLCLEVKGQDTRMIEEPIGKMLFYSSDT